MILPYPSHTYCNQGSICPKTLFPNCMSTFQAKAKNLFQEFLPTYCVQIMQHTDRAGHPMKNFPPQGGHIFSCLFYFSCPAFLVSFSGPPTPSCQKEQENHKIGPKMFRIGTRKLKKRYKKQHSSLDFWKYVRKIFQPTFPENLTRNILFPSKV